MKHHINEVAARFLRTVYYNTSIKEVCTNFGKISPVNYSKESLKTLLIDEFNEYNYQELVSHIDRFCDKFKSDKINFFDVLLDLSRNLIVRYNNSFCFKYEYTDIWRMISKEIGEEIFVIAAVLQNDYQRRYYDRKEMDWSYCIEHDNHELHTMLKRDVGVSENHFHLRGSSAYFDTSWVYLMNDISNTKYEVTLDNMEKEILNQFSEKKHDYPLKLIWRKAAAIRLYLHLYITKNEKYSKVYKTIIKDVLPYDSNKICTFPISMIQSECNCINFNSTLDYAHLRNKRDNQKYYAICGERSLLYNSLRIIWHREGEYKKVSNMLFLYLLLKHRFYTEFVQSNKRIGFYNFNQYQSRKDFIIPWCDELMVATDTISSIIGNNKIYRAELRITPQLTERDNIEGIQIYDTAIKQAISDVDVLNYKENFFYTMHFIKEDDKYRKGFCRHNDLRRKNYIQAKKLINLSIYDYDVSSRIYGIDASGPEINCRPEVFGPIFRYLQEYEPIESSRQLKATYHVGEDNYDIVDGLRAIDEAVNFLHLRSGSRLGHATMLGLSPQYFYSSKKNPISMPCQVFLDNVVWMYFFIRSNRIVFENLPHLMSYLKEKFELYFHKIFADDIYSTNVASTCIEAIQDCRYATDEPVRKEKFKFDIYHYYLSYLLRGDDPELYRNGFLSGNVTFSNGYKICHSKDKMQDARCNFEASYLYYLYHYSDKVYRKGLECVHEKLPDYFVQAVELIQKKMRYNLSYNGIAIETNPTSNLFISMIKDYSEHPISSFYDYGLHRNSDNVQLNVSINTDDKSVFSTCLSNEYAYLMFYLENKKDENGKPIYMRRDIIRWLDEIRKMGNEQSFAN